MSEIHEKIAKHRLKGYGMPTHLILDIMEALKAEINTLKQRVKDLEGNVFIPFYTEQAEKAIREYEMLDFARLRKK